jgi:ribosome-binding factor A
MATIKHKRLESQLQRTISEIITHDLKNRRDLEFVSITDVELTNDYSFLKIFVHFLNVSDDAQEQSLELLESKSGAIKAILGKKVSMRKMPELIFKIDKSFKEAGKINALLKQVEITDDSETETE